jgi:hypothetical protein
MIVRLGEVLYWCGLVVASLIAAIGVLALVITKGSVAADAWVAAVFFAIVGGLAWLAGRAAKYILAGI